MYRISAEAGYLRAELLDRETVGETRAFFHAVVRENARHRRSSVLILVRLSMPVFRVALHRLLEHLEVLSGQPARRIALVGDATELHMSHEYIEFLARQRGLNVRSFRSEAAALQWLGDQRRTTDRRQQRDRRLNGDRRRQERRPEPALLQPAR